MTQTAKVGTAAMLIFITSCEYGKDAWRTQERKLKGLYDQSDKKYELVDDPGRADIILVGDVRSDNWGKKILQNDLINRYPNKCFSLSDLDRPLILNHGVYASGFHSLLSLGRVRTGSYALYSDDYMNPYVRTHSPASAASIRKEYLFSFIGRDSHPVRKHIFNLKFHRPDIYIEDSSVFNLWHTEDGQIRRERQKHYYDILLRSKFSLCPRGDGTNSLRLFESMQLAVAPVIASDDWIFPNGPKWDEFSIRIKERQIGNVEKIVASYESRYEEMGRLARKAYESFFSEPASFNYVVENCIDIRNRQKIPEALYWRLNPLLILMLKTRVKIAKWTSSLARAADKSAR